ncbi:MAG: TRAP transporter small permease subunit [Gemmatimonadetes bacterium]|nr:TRAP transporter small permease subunit [Candidatus Palauibacter rhopaloidicola]
MTTLSTTTLRTRFESLLEGIVLVLVAALALVVVMGVGFRKFGAALVWYDEVASILLAWLTYYGAALAALKRAHIGFPNLVRRLRRPWRIPVVVAAEAVVVAFFLIAAWAGWRVLVILEGSGMVSLPWVPTRLTQSVIPIGCVLFVIAQLLSLPEMLRGDEDVDGDADGDAGADGGAGPAADADGGGGPGAGTGGRTGPAAAGTPSEGGP